MDIKHINEEILRGDFSSFDKLTEEKQNSLMKDWTKDMKYKYLTKNPVMSEEEFFAQLDKIVDGTYEW